MFVKQFVKQLALFVTLLFIPLGIAQTAQACSCIVPPAPLVALGDADAVFAGKVIRISTGKSQYGEVRNVFFEVDSYWKGSYGASVMIQTATNSAACGYDFERGKSYIVYSFLSENGLSTNICTRTSLLSQAQEDLNELGDAEELVITRSRCGGPTNAAALQAFVFLFVGMFLLRRPKTGSASEGK